MVGEAMDEANMEIWRSMMRGRTIPYPRTRPYLHTSAPACMAESMFFHGGPWPPPVKGNRFTAVPPVFLSSGKYVLNRISRRPWEARTARQRASAGPGGLVGAAANSRPGSRFSL